MVGTPSRPKSTFCINFTLVPGLPSRNQDAAVYASNEEGSEDECLHDPYEAAQESKEEIQEERDVRGHVENASRHIQHQREMFIPSAWMRSTVDRDHGIQFCQ